MARSRGKILSDALAASQVKVKPVVIDAKPVVNTATKASIKSEREKLIEELDAKGIEYKKNYSTIKLKSLLEG